MNKERKNGGKRDVMDFGTLRSQLASLHTERSCLIAQGDSVTR